MVVTFVGEMKKSLGTTRLSHPGSSGMTRDTVYRQEVNAAKSYVTSGRLVRARTIRSVYVGAPAP
jgi:hypothetical protein